MNQVIEFTSSTTDYTLFPVSNPEGKPLQTTVDVEDHPFMMEIDTGAAVSLINETTYKSQSKLPLQSSREGLGTLKQTKVKFFLKEGITPKFYKARPVPLALQQLVTAELDCLQAEGILCPIKV